MATLAATRQMSTFEVALRTFGARLFEATPGLITWILLLAPAWIPIVFPWPGAFAVATAVLLFDVYWLVRSVRVVTGVYGRLRQMRRDLVGEWLDRCADDRDGGTRYSSRSIH